MRSPGVAYRTHTKKKLEEPPYAHVICPCVSGWGCRLQVGGRVLISRDDDWRNFLIIAHFLSRCALCAAGWLSWSPRIRRRAFRRQAGRQAASFRGFGSLDGTDGRYNHASHNKRIFYFLLRSARALKHWHGVVLLPTS